MFDSKRTYIIAEAGVNHNGSFCIAKEMVNVAIKAGADAIKFQTFQTEQLACVNAPKADYQKNSTSVDQSQFQMLKSLELSKNDQMELYHYCNDNQIDFLSSPFDLGSADFLIHDLNLSCIKIASGEITNFPLLLKIAKANKSIILSTGMSTLGEIETALSILAWGYLNVFSNYFPTIEECQIAYISSDGQKILSDKVSILHCTSEYPAPFDEVNLRSIKTIRDSFNLPVGYSDHTLGIAISIAAVTYGATIIEKHFTLDKTMSGPDHQASLDPLELSSLIVGIRQIEAALGSTKKIPSKTELKNRMIARKSLVATKKINLGEIFDENNLGCKRPANGISPLNYSNMIGKPAVHNYEMDELIGIK